MPLFVDANGKIYKASEPNPGEPFALVPSSLDVQFYPYIYAERGNLVVNWDRMIVCLKEQYMVLFRNKRDSLIKDGIRSSVAGDVHIYSTDFASQTMLNAKAAEAKANLENPDWRATITCFDTAGTEVYLDLTAAQVVQAFSDVVAGLDNIQTKYVTLAKQIQAISDTGSQSSLTALQALSW